MLLAHHADAFLQIEIMGRNFPDGMSEHALAVGLAVLALGLMVYGAFALVGDLKKWRRRLAAAE